MIGSGAQPMNCADHRSVDRSSGSPIKGVDQFGGLSTVQEAIIIPLQLFIDISAVAIIVLQWGEAGA